MASNTPITIANEIKIPYQIISIPKILNAMGFNYSAPYIINIFLSKLVKVNKDKIATQSF
jgi:hypothetical protein